MLEMAQPDISLSRSYAYRMKMIVMLFLLILCSCSSKSWRDASRESVGIAPKASELKEDIVQIYYARAFAWRGYFGTHPWVAWKKVEEKLYTVAQVTAWNIRREGTSISVKKDLPDRKWFDSNPTILFEARGDKAAKIIKKLKVLIENYPHGKSYKVWPGPNSNTFVAYLIRNIEELDIELEAAAVGKDYLEYGDFFSASPSGTGFQFNLYGLLGLTLSSGEGIELNLFGVSFGIDFWTPAFKLPFIGRLGFPDKSI